MLHFKALVQLPQSLYCLQQLPRAQRVIQDKFSEDILRLYQAKKRLNLCQTEQEYGYLLDPAVFLGEQASKLRSIAPPID